MIYTYAPDMNGKAGRMARKGEQAHPDTHEVYWPHGRLVGSYATYAEAEAKLREIAHDLPEAASDWT